MKIYLTASIISVHPTKTAVAGFVAKTWLSKMVVTKRFTTSYLSILLSLKVITFQLCVRKEG